MSDNIKATLPKGTRDFGPVEMIRRNYLIGTIRDIFESFGFSAIQTPAMEYLQTLAGKYGDEGERLIFKVLNNGDFLHKADETALQEKDSVKLTPSIAKRALRYDLTVPLARFVVQHQNDLNFPFKRYQIQPVWRADRPQKGRYQEFYQCDVDVLGSLSLYNELELIQIISQVFNKLDLNVKIRLNNRKLLKALAQHCGMAGSFKSFTTIIDKADKIGSEKVMSELMEAGMDKNSKSFLMPLFEDHSVEEVMQLLKNNLSNFQEGKTGIEEMEELIRLMQFTNIDMNQVVIDPVLARGLDYYTGTIIEVIAADSEYGSICGGGRYDDLTSIFGLNGMSGVGISFGIDRIYDVLLKEEKFSDTDNSSIEVLGINFGEEEMLYLLPVINQLRENGIRSTIYPDNAKMKKQFKYANENSIKWVLVAGSEEIKEDKITIKNMLSGEQDSIEKSQIIERIING